ncbi:MAG TPA: hypothetical protein VFV66_20475 [Nonomuraea sp.]|nr:hypothetical protein [Nonomuraea sp.]
MGSVETIRASFRLDDGASLRAAFPQMGLAPEMDAVGGPLNAVVYREGWPGQILPALGDTPPRDPPGTVTICVETADGSTGIAGSDYIVYAEVPIAGSVIDGS